MIRGLWAVAILLLAGAEDRDPSAKDIVRLGNAAWSRGDFQGAAVWYERAAGLAPNSPETSYDMALSYYRLGLYAQSVRYLDREQAIAQGQLLARYLLLRADMEYKNAFGEVPIRHTEGLERALHLYRDALAASAGSALLSGIARYDIEVVKLQLPAARDQAPKFTQPTGMVQDLSADDAAAGSAGSGPKGDGKPKQEERDW